MSLLDKPQRPKGTAKAVARTKVVAGVSNLFSTLKSQFSALYATVYQNEDSLTPQEVFDSLGTSAVEVVQLAELLKTALNTAKPGTITTPSPTFTPHPDGTLTLA